MLTPDEAKKAQIVRWKNPHPSLLVGHYPANDDYIRLRVTAEGRLEVVFADDLFPIPLPVDTEDRVVLVDTEDRVVLTDETLYTGFKTRQYLIPYSADGEGIPLPTTSDVTSCKGFLLYPAPGNIGRIFVGDSPDTCFLPLEGGTPKTYSLADPQDVFVYSSNAGDSEADPVVPAGDLLIIEFYNPVGP